MEIFKKIVSGGDFYRNEGDTVIMEMKKIR